MRFITFDFRPGTTTPQHPVFLLVNLLLIAGFIWLLLIAAFRKYAAQFEPYNLKHFTALAVITGLAFRAIFIGSTPIYEDDWNRYLWDGAVITQGINPYTYSPDDIIKNTDATNLEIQTLNALSAQNGNFTARINNPHLTTIYPPAAQAVFAAAAIIKPFNLDVLRTLYLISELIAMLLLIKALSQAQRSRIWIWAYALNPIVIFTAFNGMHMDILLVPFILGAIILVQRRPALTVILTACAAAIKLWPLILGPIIFRNYRQNFLRYASYGIVLFILFTALCLPMLSAMGENSGLTAYSISWQRSSFLFPLMEAGLGYFTENNASIARLFIALVIGLGAMCLGLSRRADQHSLWALAMLITVLFFLLSPTGFPWYVIWFAFLIPLVPSYGAALLCVLVSLYYIRFWLGEAGQYDIYINELIPLQFGLPIIILLFEAFKGYKLARR